MKIASFNLRSGGRRSAENAWVQLDAMLKPDVVFAQETRHPAEYFPVGTDTPFPQVVWSPVTDYYWGSAIATRDSRLEPISVAGFEGWVVGARLPELKIGSTVHSVVTFSLHAPSPGPYLPVVNRVLDAIAKAWKGTPLIIAGDFNVTTALRQPSAHKRLHNSPDEIALLNRLRKDFGLFNAWQVMNPNVDLPQTLRWNKDKSVPYHCDGIFMSSELLPKLDAASVENAEPWIQLSDHNPVVVELG